MSQNHYFTRSFSKLLYRISRILEANRTATKVLGQHTLKLPLRAEAWRPLLLLLVRLQLFIESHK